jgi:hypothetical protein
MSVLSVDASQFVCVMVVEFVNSLPASVEKVWTADDHD